MKNFDIIIVGGGHAGVEAAHIACQFKNLQIAIISMPGVGLASAPCNPSIGGVGKGQVVREIDALGGIMSKLADMAGIQYRTLNESKGYAVQSTRVQIDKNLYSVFAEEELRKLDNLQIIFDKVLRVSKDDKFIIKSENNVYTSTKLIMTVGTFLNGKMHLGKEQTLGGRIECESSSSLDGIFSDIKTLTQRFKTGTPPRLKYDSVDFSAMEEQASDYTVRNFYKFNVPYKRNLDQVSCYLARTNESTMKTIRENLDKSPMYNGQITNAVGARYCPSIEDKAARYPDKNSHHVFVEPETLEKTTLYPSGISSSLPREVQDEIVHSIAGLEKAEIEVYGYAVEYDVVDTTELRMTLEHKRVPGLYFAGQVNGTSGYEEAAGQGLIAGANAALILENKEPMILSRRDSYIGVMIEDLVSNTRDEPYRLFTARSENRLYIREDNAINRLTNYRSQMGLNNENDLYNLRFLELFEIFNNILLSTYISPNNKFFSRNDINVPRRISLSELLKQANLDPIKTLKLYLRHIRLDLSEDLIHCLAISNKYDGYIKKSEVSSRKWNKLESKKIIWSELLDSENISFECKRRIEKIQPETFGQLSRIEGIRPATLAAVAGSTL